MHNMHETGKEHSEESRRIELGRKERGHLLGGKKDIHRGSASDSHQRRTGNGTQLQMLRNLNINQSEYRFWRTFLC